MRVIEPHDLTLVSTSVAANSEPEWSSVTTYDLDDTVQVTDRTPHKVFRSLRGSNINRYPPDWTEPQVETATSTSSLTVGIGSKSLTVQTGKGFAPGMVVKIAKTTTPRTVHMTAEIVSYDAGTGALAVSVYQATGDGTHNAWTVTSEDEIGFWEEVESTNQYKMLDEYANTQTEDITEIDVKLAVARADYIALFGLSGKTVELTLWNGDETVQLWTTTIDLAYGAAVVAQIADWYEYFFGEYAVKSECTAEIGVITYDGVLQIRIMNDAGFAVACGNVVAGRMLDIGRTQYGAQAGIIDFSYRDTDDDGRTIVTPGYWAKLNEVQLRLTNHQVDPVYRKLSSLRGVPTAWIGFDNGAYESFIVYGTFRDFSVTVAGPSYAWCRLEIEGLI
jgi:hypothetical protein